jgi:hypothetical protein
MGLRQFHQQTKLYQTDLRFCYPTDPTVNIHLLILLQHLRFNKWFRIIAILPLMQFLLVSEKSKTDPNHPFKNKQTL